MKPPERTITHLKLVLECGHEIEVVVPEGQRVSTPFGGMAPCGRCVDTLKLLDKIFPHWQGARKLGISVHTLKFLEREGHVESRSGPHCSGFYWRRNK